MDTSDRRDRVAATESDEIDSINFSRLVDVNEAAWLLGTSERHVRRLWQERRITAIKIGRRVRFRESDLRDFVEKNRRQALR